MSHKTSVLIFCGLLALALVGPLPLSAGDAPVYMKEVGSASPRPTVDSAKPILIVVDHDKKLALVQRGTVLPSGLRIASCKSTAPETDGFTPLARPCPSLVFAYAPDDRFSAIQRFAKTRAEQRRSSDTMADAPENSGERAAATLPAPDDSQEQCWSGGVVVEYGPDIWQEAECGPSGWLGFVGVYNATSYPSGAYLPRLRLTGYFYDPYHTPPYFTLDTTDDCDPQDPLACYQSVAYNPQYGYSADAWAGVRLGTQAYSNTISFDWW